MKLWIVAIAIVSVLSLCGNEKLFIAVVPSYNNELLVERNLESILSQDYSNFHIVYVDDCSTDNTLAQVNAVVDKWNAHEKVTVIHNQVRRGAMANFYNVIHTCPDKAVIVNIDGDDWLADDQVFKYLNEVYADENVWMTFGQFLFDKHDTIGFCRPFEENVIRNNLFRSTPDKLPISHPRTYYAWLFKLIRLQDLLYHGDFLEMTCDKAIMAPIVEMCGERHKCLNRVLYIYNEHNPINDHIVNEPLQRYLCSYVLTKQPYKRLTESPLLKDKSRDKTYFKISLNQFKEPGQLQKVIKILKKNDFKYIVCVNDAEITQSAALEYINVLQRTGAFVLQVGNNENLKKTKTIFMNLSFGCIAWQLKMAQGAALYPLSSNNFIIKSGDFINLVESNQGKNVSLYIPQDEEIVCLGF